jgi:tRNA-dihydrouridine synthase 1
VDINLGCPQGIAKRGNYGSFLLEKVDLICSMVDILHKNLKVPVTCKIRCLTTEAQTLHLAKSIQASGASLLTVHGRCKEHNKTRVGSANYDMIGKIKKHL